MTRLYSYTRTLEVDMVDAFCVLQKDFTDQFVYYDKQRDFRVMGLGRCIALSSLDEAQSVLQGPVASEPIFFMFNRFDAENPCSPDDMMASFPRLRLMLPEVVLIERSQEVLLQLNSLGEVYEGRVERFVRQTHRAHRRKHVSIPYTLSAGSFKAWQQVFALCLAPLQRNKIKKIVPSWRSSLIAHRPFSSKDLLINLIDGPVQGTVFLYRYGDVFFCGCTPELLVRKQGDAVESMCLAGTCARAASVQDDERAKGLLLADGKNRREHEYVVQFVREVFLRNCFAVEIPEEPEVFSFTHVHHLYTPVRAKIMEGRSLLSLAEQLHPTPALAGTPVGEALMTLRRAEGYNRGFFGGTVGYVDGAGNGELSVAIRCGVFDGERGFLYAGCGVVAGSNARAEFEEIRLKMQTALSAFEAPEQAVDACRRFYGVADCLEGHDMLAASEACDG